ncbi:MAG: methionine--tRNA ligase [bacterium]|nr:methionine--tRNA ligase [bacterium]
MSSKQKEKILVTSALPYANGPIHLGHLAGAYLPADIFVRYHRLKNDDVIYICGSDEHGVPITLRAEEEGVTPQEVADKYHDMNKMSFENVGISFDNFSKTTLPIHYETSKEFFTDIYEKGHFVKKGETQLYCEKDNMFLADRFVEGVCPKCGNLGARGDQCEKCGKWLDPTTLKGPKCKLCGSTPVQRTTEHWYIKLGEFQKELEDWILNKKDWKDNVLNFCKGWFDQGLEDRAVTRDLDWGIPVPLEEAQSKVLYVWFDAPIGYISSTKEWALNIGEPEKWKEYWCDSETKLYHFIGKDNIVFHAIFFPVILKAMGGGYILPENVVANEFLNLESRKFSTSQNFAVWLNDYLDTFPPDPLRYCLASISPESKDSDFSWKDFQARNNNELADVLGNFINRTLVFAYKNFEGKVPEPVDLSDEDKAVLESADKLLDEIEDHLKKFRVRQGIGTFMEIARRANKYFNDAEPWVSLKKDLQKCANTVYTSIQIVKKLALGMAPFMPFSNEKLIKMINVENEFNTGNWDEIKSVLIPAGSQINKPGILFSKIEDDIIDGELEKLKLASAGKTESSEDNKNETEKDTLEEINIDDFKKIDLRIAEIKSASPVPKTEKLLRLEVDDGEDIRFIISGIADKYTSEDLVGKKIVLIANLKPAKIRGEISNGMLLAAVEGEDLALIIADKDMKTGTRIS